MENYIVLSILAHTGSILNLGYKMSFFHKGILLLAGKGSFAYYKKKYFFYIF